jgi:hypothetical protein
VNSDSQPTLIPEPATLEDAVLLTLSYYDALGLPATAFEVWQNLIKFRASYLEVVRAMERLPLKSLLTVDRGYYSLRDLDHIETRFTKQKVSEMRWRKARRTARWLAAVPFVTSVSVVNNVALNNANASSDIDLFITVKPGRLWTARLLVTALTNLLRRRRHARRIADRICLSFYVTDSAYNFEKLAVNGGDVYLAHWIFNLGTLWQRRGRQSPQQELDRHNPWIHQIFTQREFSPVSPRRQVGRVWSWVVRLAQAPLELVLQTRLGNWVEAKVRAFQLGWMHKTVPTEIKTPTSHILITDDMLKFHEQDRRLWFRERMLASYKTLRLGHELVASLEIPSIHAGLFVKPIGATITT